MSEATHMLISQLHHCALHACVKAHTVPHKCVQCLFVNLKNCSLLLELASFSSVLLILHIQGEVTQSTAFRGDPPLLAQAIHLRLSAKAASRPMR